MQRACRDGGDRPRGDDEARVALAVVACAEMLRLGDDAARAAPALVRLIGQLGEDARRWERPSCTAPSPPPVRRRSARGAGCSSRGRTRSPPVDFAPCHQRVVAEPTVRAERNPHV